MASQRSYTAGEVALASALSLSMGAALGAALVHRETRRKLRSAKLKFLDFLKLGSLLGAPSSPSSSNGKHLVVRLPRRPSSPHKNLTLSLFFQNHAGAHSPGMRGIELPPGTGMEDALATKVAVVLLNAALEDPADAISHTSVTVLAQFKKCYKRRDPALKLWEAGGHKMDVRVASSEAVLLAVQAAARQAGVGTHVFAGQRGGVDGSGKQRSIVVLGPADKAVLKTIVGRLEEL